MNEFEQNKEVIRRYLISGSRTFSNYWWASIICIGSCGFIMTGFSSFFRKNLLPFINTDNIVFFPQGLVMLFYGFLGLIFSLYLWFTVLWRIGSGFNEFNKKDGFVRIFRWGFPGKNRRIDYSYPINEIESIKVVIQEGINPKRAIYMKLKGKKEIPLTRIGEPITLEELELQASELAKFLKVTLEMS